MTKKSIIRLCLMGVLVLSALVLSACAPAPTPTEAPVVVVPDTPVPPTEVPTPAPADQTEYYDLVALSGHGTYDYGKGPNDYCSRCHSPQNWNPESQAGAAPNCVTCKFATDAELRIAETMNFVDEADWVGIPCETCHEVMANGEVSSSIAWLNPLTLTYETMNTPNELCRKCHVTSAGVKFSGGRGAVHEIVLGGSAHMKYAGEFPQADRPQYCSDCHDPHSTQPKACQDCHTDIAESETHMKGYNALMLDTVECMACHDASGAEVGPNPDDDSGIFTTMLTSVGRSGPTVEAIVSHSIQWQVACDRCHFEGNEWELSVRDADGEPVEVEAEATTTP